MEPWDGPAAIVATDSRWVVAGLDRSGLRPMRYSRTRDGLLVVGSETGMVPLTDHDVIEKGRVGPGENIAVDLATGTFYHDLELKDHLAGLKPYGRWMENITHLDERVRRPAVRAGPLRAGRAAPPADPVRPHRRGHGADPRAHGARRQGGRGLDGRRHAAGGPVRGTIAACTISSASSSARSPTRRSTRCANGG